MCTMVVYSTPITRCKSYVHACSYITVYIDPSFVMQIHTTYL